MTPIIFLDIDGVLNRHVFNREAGSGTIDPKCVKQLNRILRATGAKIVLSSAWRYMIHRRAMTLKGFDYLLRTHGVIADSVVGMTDVDERCAGCRHRYQMVKDPIQKPRTRCAQCWAPMNRASQIWRWMTNNCDVAWKYIILDDMDMGCSLAKLKIVLCDGRIGLTRRLADRAIEMLGRTH